MIKVYTLNEVAEILKVTRRTLYNYIKEGKLQAVKIGKYWRVEEKHLQAFLTTGTAVVDQNRRKENQGNNV